MKRLVLLAAAITLLAGCAPKAQEPKVMAREVPERADDFVFENNLIAGRFYGKALEGNPTSPGLDIWVKLPGRLVADEWYAADQKEPGYYHRNHGGKDCYKVAVSLGGGASVPFVNDSLCWPATNYRSSEILSKKADQIVFVLHYPEWQAAEGIRVALDKKVTVKADSYFFEVEDTYTFSGTERLPVAVGMKLHSELSTVQDIFQSEAKDRWAIWEKASDTGAEPEDGLIGVAVVLPGAESALTAQDHALLVKTVASGEPLRYCVGNCWSKGDIQSAAAWFGLVKGL